MNSLFELVLSWVFARIIAIGPKISYPNGRMVATTKLKAHIMCLGFGSRRVMIDINRRVVTIDSRSWWFVPKHREIQFDQVDCVIYDYSNYGAGLASYQDADLFRVSIQLKSGEKVLLFRFFGEGDYSTSVLPDWMLYDQIIKSRITMTNQEVSSEHFADIVAGLIGVTIGDRDLIG